LRIVDLAIGPKPEMLDEGLAAGPAADAGAAVIVDRQIDE
jgi:hypothetical protein